MEAFFVAFKATVIIDFPAVAITLIGQCIDIVVDSQRIRNFVLRKHTRLPSERFNSFVFSKKQI